MLWVGIEQLRWVFWLVEREVWKFLGSDQDEVGKPLVLTKC